MNRRAPQIRGRLTVLSVAVACWPLVAAAFAVPFAIGVAISVAGYEAPPPPRINIRWGESVVPVQRDALEAAHRLAEPEFQEGRTWTYTLLDSSTASLRRIVQDPSVEDTHGVNRTTFRLSDRPTPLFVALRLLGIPALVGLAMASLVIWMRMERLKRSAGATATDSLGRAGRPTWIFHPLLIAAYPILQLFGQNVEEVPVAHIIYPLAVSVVAGVTIWALAWPIFRSLSRSAIVSSITMPALMFFEPVREFVTGLAPFLGRGYVFIGLGVAIYLGLFSRLRVMERAAIEPLTKALNVFAITIVLVALFPVAGFYASDDVAGSPPSFDVPSRFDVASWSCRVGYCPDIYYLVLDGYGRADALEAAYGIDNEPFLSALRADGFLVARRSTANYSNTLPALQSSLNLDYQHAPQDGTTSFEVDVNLAALLLRKLGYRYVLVPSGYRETSSSPLADITIDVGQTQSELTALALERSVLGAVIRSDRKAASALMDGEAMNLLDAGAARSLDGALQWHRHIEGTFQSIGDLAAGDGPKFVFAHIVSPHPPYVFDRNGEMPPDSRMSDLSDIEEKNIWDSPRFAPQLDYVNRLVLGLVDRIRAEATRPPVIIIHGDHGTYRFGGPGLGSQPTDRLLAERMSILFAVLAPSEITAQFHEGITPVNAFRALFRGLFGAPLSLLDDRNYWSYVAPPREVTDVVQSDALNR